MVERFKEWFSFIFWHPVTYIFASSIVILCVLFGCQGLMNVNGSENNVVVTDSFKKEVV